MSLRTYVVASKAIACIGYCFLVVNDAPWWGLLCIFFAAYMDDTGTAE